MDDDGFKEPYRLIICDKSQKVVFLEPYFDEDGITQNDDVERCQRRRDLLLEL